MLFQYKQEDLVILYDDLKKTHFLASHLSENEIKKKRNRAGCVSKKNRKKYMRYCLTNLSIRVSPLSFITLITYIPVASEDTLTMIFPFADAAVCWMTVFP